MNDEELAKVEQARQFLEGSKAVAFEGISVEEQYRWIESL